MGIGSGNLKATFLGSNASFTNQYIQYGQTLTNALVGSSSTTNGITGSIDKLDFNFNTITSAQPVSLAANGNIFTPADSEVSPSFALLNVDNSEEGTFYLGFNDYFAGTPDFNDYVVKLEYAPSAIPAPASLSLMTSALGLFVFGINHKTSANK